MGLISRVSSRTYRESHPTKMLARFAVQARMAKVRALSGSAAILGGAPPGYQNIYLPDKEMPQPLPRGGMTPALRAQLAKKYNMRPEDYKPCAVTITQHKVTATTRF